MRRPVSDRGRDCGCTRQRRRGASSGSCAESAGAPFGSGPAASRIASRISVALISTSRPGKQIKRCAFSGGIHKMESADLDSGRPSIASRRRLKRKALRQRRLQSVERLTGPRGDDERRRVGNLRGAMPVTQSEKGVRAHQAIKRCLRLEFRAQAVECFEGVIRRFLRRSSAWVFWRIGKRNRKPRLAFDGQPGHRQPVFKACRRSLGLERLRADRRKQNGIQMEGIAGGTRNGQMAQMRRVETSAEEGDAHRMLPSQFLVARRASAHGLIHGFIVQCSLRRPIRRTVSAVRQLESG